MMAAPAMAAGNLHVGRAGRLAPAQHGIVKVESLPQAKQQPKADLDAVLRWEERRRDVVTFFGSCERKRILVSGVG